jgi:hypothetical protein
MAKDRNGQVKPHNLGGSRFKDGSLRQVNLVRVKVLADQSVRISLSGAYTPNSTVTSRLYPKRILISTCSSLPLEDLSVDLSPIGKAKVSLSFQLHAVR